MAKNAPELKASSLCQYAPSQDVLIPLALVTSTGLKQVRHAEKVNVFSKLVLSISQCLLFTHLNGSRLSPKI